MLRHVSFNITHILKSYCLKMPTYIIYTVYYIYIWCTYMIILYMYSKHSNSCTNSSFCLFPKNFCPNYPTIWKILQPSRNQEARGASFHCYCCNRGVTWPDIRSKKLLTNLISFLQLLTDLNAASPLQTKTYLDDLSAKQSYILTRRSYYSTVYILMVNDPCTSIHLQLLGLISVDTALLRWSSDIYMDRIEHNNILITYIIKRLQVAQVTPSCPSRPKPHECHYLWSTR